MRVRRYAEDPSIGIEKVERILDAAHALSWNCRRNLAIRKLSPPSRSSAPKTAQRPPDPFQKIHARKNSNPDLHKVPLEPDEDLLLFIRDHNPYLAEWEKDLLTIVDEEAKYFIPMMETKIMNEGWASYWHQKIVESLRLEQGLHLEFIVRSQPGRAPDSRPDQSVSSRLKIWEDIDRRWTNPTAEEIKRDGPPTKTGARKTFRGARGRTRLFVPAPLPDRRADARDGYFRVRSARRRSGRQQSRRRRRLEGGQGNADQERRHQLDSGDQGRGRRLRPEPHAVHEASITTAATCISNTPKRP